MEKKKFLTPQELEIRPLGRPARSQPRYRLRYPRSHNLLQFCRPQKKINSEEGNSITFPHRDKNPYVAHIATTESEEYIAYKVNMFLCFR
jgi:hypothetical protein